MNTKELTQRLIITWQMSRIENKVDGTSSALAKLIGITKSTMSRIETGVTTIKTDNLQKLLKEVEKIAGASKVFQLFSKWLSND